MRYSLFWAVLLGGVAVTHVAAHARGGRLPRGCDLVEARQIADQDGDGRPERVVRCRRAPRGCEELFVLYSRVGRRRVARLCAPGDDPGVEGGAIELERGRVIQRRWGGSAWAWEQRCAWDLKKRRVVETREKGVWRAQRENGYEQRVDADSGRREVRWWAPVCAAQGHDDPFGAPGAEVHRGRYVPIPLREGARPSTGRPCRGCRVRLPREGYVRSRGRFGGAADASLAVGARDDGAAIHLELSARDDRWTAADRIVVLIGDEPAGFDVRCLPLHVAVRTIAIAPFSARPVGARPAGVQVSVGGRGRVRTVEVSLGGAWRARALENGLSVVFRDHDGKGRSPTQLSTSRIDDLRDGRDLGRFGPVAAAATAGRSLYGHELAGSCADSRLTK